MRMGREKMTNCKNCGAPLNKTGKCEYCGTVFKKPSSIDCSSLGSGIPAYLPDKIKIVVNGSEVEGYVQNVTIEETCVDRGRDINGRIMRPKVKTIARFECVAELQG